MRPKKADRFAAANGVIALLAGLLASCGPSSTTTTNAISCGPGTHDVSNVCEEDAAIAIVAGSGSYWKASFPSGAYGAVLYFQFSNSASNSVGGSGLCTFADSQAIEPPGSGCTTSMTADALTYLTAIVPDQIPNPTSFTATVTSSEGTRPITFTLAAGDPTATGEGLDGATGGVTPQAITWSEGTNVALGVTTSIDISGCPYFAGTECTVHTN